MSENSEFMPLFPFVSDRNRMPERKLVARGTAPVLNFRTRQMPIEPEDARITGTTRSLYRRLLALNLRKPVVAALSETEAYMPSLTA